MADAKSRKTPKKKPANATRAKRPTAKRSSVAAKKTTAAKTTAATNKKAKSTGEKKLADLNETGNRKTGDRRKKNVPVAVERRKAPRRRQIDPTTCERDYKTAEIEFMHALDEYKRSSGRMFPTCSEILEVLQGLGYQKVGSTAAESQDSNTVESTGVTDSGLADPSAHSDSHVESDTAC